MNRPKKHNLLAAIMLTIVGTGGLMAAVYSERVTDHLGNSTSRMVLVNGNPTRMQVSSLDRVSVDPEIVAGLVGSPGEPAVDSDYSPIYAHGESWVARVLFPNLSAGIAPSDVDNARRVKISLIMKQENQPQETFQFDVPFTSAAESSTDSRSLVEVPDYLTFDKDSMVYSVSNETATGMSDMWVIDTKLDLLSRVQKFRSRMAGYGYELDSEQAGGSVVLHTYSKGASNIVVYSSSDEIAGTRDVIHAQIYR